ncbi:MAG: hypothetical protein O3A36_03345 [bacterium]|nr:hypothetical protein [bacterium]
MSLAALREKILSEAVEVAAKVSRANNVAMQEERTRALQELHALEEGIVSAAHTEAERLTRIVHQQANLTGRSLVLSAKQEALTKTKEAFIASIKDLSKDEKKLLHKALLVLVPKGKDDVDLDADGIGFVFRGEGMEMNLTISHLADQIFWKYRSELAIELFR